METELVYVLVVCIFLGFLYGAYLYWKKKNNKEKLDIGDIVDIGKEVVEHKDEIKKIGEAIVKKDGKALKDKVVEHKDDILDEVDEAIEGLDDKGE